MAEKPGVMIYFDSIRPALSRLDDSQLGALFRAIIEYAQTGAVADLDNMAGFAFDSLRPKIDRDDERYQERNREIALSRLENRIVQALVIPKKRIKTKPTRASKERKLKLKKIRSEIKKNRSKIW